MESLVDKMRPLQIAYNLDKAGVKNVMPPNMSFTEEWARGIFKENEELFKNKSEEEFINFVIYGTRL